jgi:NADPH-dependent curcumin reductase CurA
VAPLLTKFARVPVCGLIGQAGATEFPSPDRLPGFMRDVLSKSLTIRGFINYDFGELYPDFLRDIGPSIKDGEIKYKEDIVDGLDNAPKAFMGMLEGRNFGKLLIRMRGVSSSE